MQPHDAAKVERNEAVGEDHTRAQKRQHKRVSCEHLCDQQGQHLSKQEQCSLKNKRKLSIKK